MAMGARRASLTTKQQEHILQAEDWWFVIHYPTALLPKGKNNNNLYGFLYSHQNKAYKDIKPTIFSKKAMGIYFFYI